ncbi:hypothetical protein [Wolbachia endosymbiont of Pentidionis agamae]|uniref:hypothetical protein n=1 Tax=Wolbachia endosymbiont of Pentidionis agamae TaxID=3110435 RepID=UPI002FD11285
MKILRDEVCENTENSDSTMLREICQYEPKIDTASWDNDIRIMNLHDQMQI